MRGKEAGRVEEKENGDGIRWAGGAESLGSSKTQNEYGVKPLLGGLACMCSCNNPFVFFINFYSEFSYLLVFFIHDSSLLHTYL